MCIYLNGLCAAGVKRFNNIFTSFYARQWYDVINDVTCVSLTVEDRLLIKGLHIERVGNVDRMTAEFPGIQWKQRTFLRTKEHMNNQFLVTMSTSTNKHRYKINY